MTMKTALLLLLAPLLVLPSFAAEKGKRGRERAASARPGGVTEAFQVREFKGSNGQTLRYSLFVPKENPESLPVVLCLHGSGGNTAAAKVLASPKLQQKHPCIVMAPGCDSKNTRWVKTDFGRNPEARAVMPELIDALDAVILETKSDPSRIYITGQSMGGVGTWGIIASYPNRFAAAVPVCGIWPVTDAAKMNGVPIWAFHGAEDPTVPVSGSRDMIEALRKAGVKPEPKFTEFPGVGHNSWDTAYGTGALWDWVFAQRRAVP